MNKMDAVDAALAPVPLVSEKVSMLDTLKEMGKNKKGVRGFLLSYIYV